MQILNSTHLHVFNQCIFTCSTNADLKLKPSSNNNNNLNIYFSRLIPQVAENAAARALQEGEAEGLQEGEAEGLQEGEVPREGGDSRGKRVGESIPDGWRPEASPPAGRSYLWKQDASPPAERERERERIPY